MMPQASPSTSSALEPSHDQGNLLGHRRTSRPVLQRVSPPVSAVLIITHDEN